MIFRRLWALPLGAASVILRKTAINEILFGYTGELYFYVWARRRAGLVTAPFAAIKDVNILSAVASNVLTLVTLALSAFVLKGVDLGRELGPMLWPGLVVVAVSFVIILFARRVFSLTRAELAYVSVVHAVRLCANSALTVLLWRLALPEVGFPTWLALLAGRLLLSRLPFVANKDLVFANLLLALFGAGSPVALLLTTLALVTLAAHLAVLAAVGAPQAVRLLSRSAATLAQDRFTMRRHSPARPRGD